MDESEHCGLRENAGGEIPAAGGTTGVGGPSGRAGDCGVLVFSQAAIYGYVLLIVIPGTPQARPCEGYGHTCPSRLRT
ncbi:MAG TPA: hypothetical protein VM223_25620 [Planctomycetota bacterium]|nr:hypothetical protein [Planctomycetota bacterium]